MRRRVLPLLVSVVAAACTAPAADGLQDVHACLELPDGVDAATVLDAVDDTSVAGDGCFTLRTFASGPQLAIALSSAGDPVAMGWLSPDRPVLDARSTAEALAFHAIGGSTAPPALVASVLDQLADSTLVDPVADAVADALAADPAGFRDTPPDLASALTQAAVGLLDPKGGAATAATATSRLHLVNPSDEQSGIRLNTVISDRDITFQNTYRRSAYAYIERVSVFDDEGEHPSPAKIAELEIPSVQALQGGLGTIGQILAATQQPGGLEGSQDVAYVPRDAGTIRLDNLEGYTKTRYRVVVVGPGRSPGAEAELTDEQRTKQIEVERTFVVKELILPMVLQMLVPASDANDYLDSAFGAGAVQDLISVFTSLAPTVWDKAAAGDMKGALRAAYDGIVSSNTLRDQIFAVIADHFTDFRSAATEAGAGRAMGIASKFAAVSGALDAVLGAGDVLAVAGAVGASDQANVWTVDIADTRVRLDPPAGSVAFDGRLLLTTHIPSAGEDAAFEYRYSTPGNFGALDDGLHQGIAFTTTSATVTYVAGSEAGTDEVRVEVFAIRLSERDPVGEATATVEVTATPGPCAFLAGYCPTCDLEDHYDACVATAASGNDAQCQQAYENTFLDFCYPTSAYCESLRAACETCTDPNDRINCIAASSSQYAYDDPSLCLNFDIALRAPTCTPP